MVVSNSQKKQYEVCAHATNAVDESRTISYCGRTREEQRDIVTAKDFLSAGKLTRYRRCDATKAFVSRLGEKSMIKIETKVKGKLG